MKRIATPADKLSCSLEQINKGRRIIHTCPKKAIDTPVARRNERPRTNSSLASVYW